MSEPTVRFGGAEVQAYLHRNIPLSAVMGVTVHACDDTGVTLRAPLAPNINHHATVFGGSASAVAILAGWTYLFFTLRRAGLNSGLVIQRNTIDYLAPITGDFEARCPALPASVYDRFFRTLQRHGRARIEACSTLERDGNVLAQFRGDYVAVRLD